jgi:WD40 repeat protein/serine/threonine protein kinase
MGCRLNGVRSHGIQRGSRCSNSDLTIKSVSRGVRPSLNLICESVAMTSHPDAESTTPEPDRDESAEQQTGPGMESDAEATIAGSHASGFPENKHTVVDASETVHPRSNTDVASDMILAEKLERVLEEFAQTLVPEHQDLNRTRPETSLKPAVDSGSSQSSRHESFSQSRSARPRSIQRADSTAENEGSQPVEDIKSADFDLDYMRLDKLGEGGRGTVHLARQVALGREVALKQIHQRSSRRQLVRDEFLTEAVLTGNLEHPNIVPIYEVGESAGGELFYSMKNVKGRAWNETIDELTLNENLAILMDVCDAISFAHTEGVIHRDLKPHNIMTGGFGEVLVLDWGLAVMIESGKDVNASAGGTPCYMAPEMINTPFLVGPRSDVYLLGAILFRFLTGKTPHAGTSAMSSLKAASKNEIVNPDRQRMQRVDPTGELLNVASKAMATTPADRYQTVGEFQQAVREFESHRESLTLAKRAEEALQAAEKSDEYRQYSRSMVGFEEAVTLWGGNQVAQKGIERARQAYALCAERKEDYELGLSLLEESVSQHGDAIQRLIAARDERNTRQGRLRRLKQGLSLAAVLIVVIVGNAAWWINDARLEAEKQKHIAIEARERTETTLARSNYVLAEARWDNNRVADAREQLQEVPRQYRTLEWYLARRQFEGSDETLYGHREFVCSVMFSPDGTRIVSGSGDKTIRLWDASTGEELHTLEGHEDRLFSVSFSPDGTRIASGSKDQTIRLWDASTGEQIRILGRHAEGVTSVSFSPDGTRIASGSKDQTIRLWDASTGEELHTLEGHAKGVTSVSFSPDGTRIASGSWDQTIRLWDTSTGEELHILNKGRDKNFGVLCVSFSPDGTRIASGFWDHAIRVWDASTGEQLHTLEEHTNSLQSVGFSPDGTRIASASLDHTIRLWDALTGEQLRTLKGHTDRVFSVSFSPDGTRIVSASEDQTIRLWDVSTDEQLHTLEGHTEGVTSVSFSPDGTRITTGSGDKTIRMWDVSTGEQLNTLRGHEVRVTSVSFSPDGTRVVSASGDHTIRLWDASTGEQIRILGRHEDWVLSVSFSPDGTRIASASADQRIRLWDASTGEEIPIHGRHDDRATSVSFSPDGTRIATGSADQTIRMWDVSTGEQLNTLKGHTERVTSVSFSPDGARIVSASWDQTIRLWDASTGEEIRALKGHTDEIYSVNFSPDGTRIASGSKDQTIRLWDASTGEELRTLKGHTDEIYSVNFSSDGTRIASGSKDQTIRLWDASTDEETRTLKGHTDRVTGVSFSPDGSRIASASADQTIRLWDAPTGEELHILKGHTDRVTSVSFSPDGRRLLSQDSSGKQLIWDLISGAILPDGNVEEFSARNDFNKSRDGRWHALSFADDVLLVDLAYKQTPRERQRRKLLASPKPRWHRKQFQSAQSAKQWYAAVFHGAWLLKLQPSDVSLRAGLQEAHRNLLAAHNGQSPPLPAVVNEMFKQLRGSKPPAEANN